MSFVSVILTLRRRWKPQDRVPLHRKVCTELRLNGKSLQPDQVTHSKTNGCSLASAWRAFASQRPCDWPIYGQSSRSPSVSSMKCLPAPSGIRSLPRPTLSKAASRKGFPCCFNRWLFWSQPTWSLFDTHGRSPSQRVRPWYLSSSSIPS